MQQRHQYLSLIMKRAWKAFKSGKGTHSQCLKASWKVYKTNKKLIKLFTNQVKECQMHILTKECAEYISSRLGCSHTIIDFTWFNQNIVNNDL